MEPTYRIIAVPKKPTDNLIDVADQKIWDLIKAPPQLRENGFGFRGASEVKRTQGGCEGFGIAQQKISIFQNGIIELTSSLLNRHFQWHKSEINMPVENWLYPYAISEMPLSFILFVNKLLYMSGYFEGFYVQQDYFHVKDFVLVPGHPTNFIYIDDEFKVYEDTHILGTKYESHVLASAWEIHFKLVLEVYQFFSLPTQSIPNLRELEGFPFSFDYMDFFARYKYLTNAICVEILNKNAKIRWSCEIPIENVLNEINAIGKGINEYKKLVREKGKHP